LTLKLARKYVFKSGKAQFHSEIELF